MLFEKQLAWVLVFHLLDEINGGLVVLIAEVLCADALFPVLLLLQSEDVLVELELQTLVGIVDAKLLEGVFLNGSGKGRR